MLLYCVSFTGESMTENEGGKCVGCSSSANEKKGESTCLIYDHLIKEVFVERSKHANSHRLRMS